MRQSGFRAWKVFGGLVATALLGVGCGELPVTGGRRPNDPPLNFIANEVHGKPQGYYERFQYSPNRGYNGTIKDIGSSIDPRTPAKAGVAGRSRLVDPAGRPAPPPPELGIGGSGAVGNPEGSNDMGWRARRGLDVEPLGNFGSYGGDSR